MADLALAARKAESMSTTKSHFGGEIKVVIDWTIPFFSSLKGQTEPLCSGKTVVGNSTWWLSVYPLDPDGFKARGTETTGAYISHRFSGTEDHKIHTRFKIGLLDTDDKCLENFSYECSEENGQTAHFGIFTPDDECMGCPAIVRHSDVWSPNAGVTLENDCLKIRGEVRYLPTDETSLSRIYTMRPAEPLKKKLKVMAVSDVGKDFVLVSADGTERRVHRAVLNANSTYFQAMFEADMKESKEGRCDIPDITTQALDILINFMYFDYSQANLRENAQEVLVAADKYQLDDLKEACEHILVSEITHETVADLLILADRVSAGILKEAAVRYVLANLSDMEETGQVKKICKEGGSDLAQDIISAMARQQKK